LSDWHGYATRLATKLGYQNTYYDTEPRLDIASVESSLAGSCDFVIASDVFEHVAPPVSQAFRNLCALLKPDGVAIFTVPYGKAGRTVEHFPELHDYTILETGGRLVLRNTTRAGVLQTFDTLTFHGGPGATLEMRRFSEQSLIDELHAAGFGTVKTYPARHLEHGIYWPEDWAFPMSLRRAADRQPVAIHM
jgi:SAM-dependent methyltransferase